MYSNDIENIDQISDLVSEEVDRGIKSKYGNSIDYEESDVKKVLDKWIDKFDQNDLVRDKYGYYVRLPIFNEMLDFGVENQLIGTSYIYKTTSNTPLFLIFKDDSWISGSLEDLQNKVYRYSYGEFISTDISSTSHIRPILNVKKNSVEVLFRNVIDNPSSILEKLEYKVGDVVNYNGINFFVLRDSKKTDSTVTLIKAEPLTIEEVNNYGAGHINEYIYERNQDYQRGKALSIGKYGGIAYYNSSNCRMISPNQTIVDNCKSDYNKSDIKYVVDAWAKDKIDSNDLGVDDYGYKIRLLNDVDLVDYLKYESSNKEITDGGEYLKYTEYTPDFNLYNCWSMSKVHDGNLYVLIRGVSGYFYTYPVYMPNGTVCPVVTLKKNYIDTVNVPNTKSKSNLYIIITIIVIFIISLLITTLLLKNKKNKVKNN